MSSGLQTRLERLQEVLSLEPPTMVCVVIARFDGGATPEGVRDGEHYLGPYANCIVMGGTRKEQRAELRRLRESADYDRDPCQRAGSGKEMKAISGGSTVGEPGP